MTLRDLKIGNTATILSVGGNGALRQHFLDMGLIQGAEVTVVKYAPMGDPIELRIHGYELTIRLEDAKKIEISNPHEAKQEKTARRKKETIPHPGYGEGESTMNAKQKILCRRTRCSPLRLWEIRTVGRRRCLTS